MWFNIHPSLQPQRCVTFPYLWFTDIHPVGVFKGTYVLTTTRNLSSANGLGAAKVLRGSMTASVTSSCIRTTAHSLATVAGSPLHGLMRSIVTVRHFSSHLSSVGTDGMFVLQYAQRVVPVVRRHKIRALINKLPRVHSNSSQTPVAKTAGATTASRCNVLAYILLGSSASA